jgi:hypothetical protein
VANRLINLTDNERGELIAALPASSKLRKKIERAGNRIAVRSAKAKGMLAQIIVCEWISKLVGIPFLRGNDDSLIKPRPSGQNGVDIILEKEIRKKFPFSVEVKNQEQLNLVEAIEQADTNKTEGTDWLLYHKRKALKEDIVIISRDTFEKIYVKKQ